MKRESRRRAGKGIGMAAAGILCAMFMGACGKTAENAAVPMETAQENAGIGAFVEAGAEAESAETDAGESEGAGAESAETDAGTADIAEAESAETDAGTADIAEAESAESSAGETADAADAPTVTWNGMIEEVGINSFAASEIFTDAAEDGLVMVYQPEAEDKAMIEVVYTDRTVFTIRTTKNSGMEYSDSPGSSADLKADISCVMTGSWDGARFLASEILIYHHQ